VKWQIGIVRRLSRVNSDTSSVGIETLSESPSLVMLYDIGTSDYTVNGSDSNSSRLPNPSLLLTGSDGSHSLILDPVHYLPGKVCQINGAPNLKLISLGKPLEHSEGWIRVATELVSG
jgi:hypothetical protein